MKKKIYIFLIFLSVKAWGGLRALADMSAKNMFFFGRLPYKLFFTEKEEFFKNNQR